MGVAIATPVSLALSSLPGAGAPAEYSGKRQPVLLFHSRPASSSYSFPASVGCATLWTALVSIRTTGLGGATAGVTFTAAIALILT